MIDADGNGSVSKLELLDAVQRCPEVSRLILPFRPHEKDACDEDTFDMVKTVFDKAPRCVGRAGSAASLPPCATLVKHRFGTRLAQLFDMQADVSQDPAHIPKFS